MDIFEKYPMVKLITFIISLSDLYGINHSERVAELCMQIGTRISLPPYKLEDLQLAALLHDIGKLGIPETTRTKPGMLTQAEYWMMQQHTRMGLHIIQQMNGSLS